MKNKNFFFLLCFVIFVHSFAQNGTLKIFSEIDNISIFIDELFVGQNSYQIDNLQKGTHYLKILKDGIVIHDSIISILEDGTTTIVIKNSPQIMTKLIQAKSRQFQEYESLKISIGDNINFYQGKRNLTLSEYARILGKDVEKYEKIEKKISSEKNKQRMIKNIINTTGSILFFTGLTTTVLTFSSILVNWPPLNQNIYDALPYIGTASILGCIVGYGIITFPNSSLKPVNLRKYLSYEDEEKSIRIYNDSLMKELGISEFFKAK